MKNNRYIKVLLSAALVLSTVEQGSNAVDKFWLTPLSSAAAKSMDPWEKADPSKCRAIINFLANNGGKINN
jgi:hypothetical protein